MTFFHKIIYAIFLGLASSFYSEMRAQNFSAEFLTVNSDLANTFSSFSMNANDTNYAYYYSGGTEPLKGIGYVANILHRCSNSGTIAKKVFLTSSGFSEPLPAVSFVLLENTIVTFTVLQNKEKDLIMYACELNAKTLEQVGTPVPVLKYNSKSWSLMGGRLPLIVSSENHKLVMLGAFENDALKATTLHGVLLNAKLEKLWDKTFSSEKDLQAMLLTQTRLTDDGQLMMTGFTGKIEESSRQIASLSKSAYHVFTLEDQSAKIFDHEIILDTVNPLNVRASFLGDGSFVCAGFYGKDNNIGSGGSQISRGVYYIRYEAHSVVPVIKNVTSFPAVFIQEAMDEPGGPLTGRPTKGLSNVRLTHLVACADGSIVILGEHSFLGGDFSPGFHLQEIDAISFSFNGEVNWFKRIGKHQIVENGERDIYSFSPFESNGKILVFFNDHEESSDDASDPNPETFKGPFVGNFVCVSINGKGEMKKDIVLSFNKTTQTPQPSFMHQTGESSFDCRTAIAKMSQKNAVLRINYKQ